MTERLFRLNEAVFTLISRQLKKDRPYVPEKNLVVILIIITFIGMNYRHHLSNDSKLKPLIRTIRLPELLPQKNICAYLCFSIMSQQLSAKVANVIRQRFLDLFGGQVPASAQILNVPPTALRKIGLSNAKVSYVRNVAQFDLDSGLDFEKLNEMSDREIISYLTEIKGVGQWTAEMLLMFALAREDVFSAGDLGLQQAMQELYHLREPDQKTLKTRMSEIASAWSPYRTYACMLLWRYKDKV